MPQLDGSLLRMLVVEDDPELAQSIGSVLSAEGYLVRIAHHGDEALTICEQWLPDGIVLDHNLPVMTGEQFLQEIRWRPELSRVPILLISALTDVRMIARRLCVRHFLCKPFPPGDLLDLVARMIAARTTLRKLRAAARKPD
jgi:CheY-like chemotaxis protein